MARRKRRVVYRYPRKKRRRVKKSVSLAVVGGLIYGLTSSEVWQKGPIQYLMDGNYVAAGNAFLVNFTGYNPVSKKFDITKANGLKGVFIGYLIHKVCGWIGLNRHFARMPSPLNKLRI